MIRKTPRSISSTRFINENDFLRDEYNNLRQEIGNRIGLRYQILQIALGAAGTIIGFGFQTTNPSLILLYPILGLILLIVFVANSYETQRLDDYIKCKIEARVKWIGKDTDGYGWERFKEVNKNEGYSLAGYLGARCTFVFTEILAILAAVYTKPETTFLSFLAGVSVKQLDFRVNFLLVLALISLLLTLFITSFKKSFFRRIGEELEEFLRRWQEAKKN